MDHSVKLPCGEFEDFRIQIKYVFVPYNFIIMDMKEDPITPLTLGRDTLKTLGVTIFYKTNSVTIKVGVEKLRFEFSKTMKQPMI